MISIHIGYKKEKDRLDLRDLDLLGNRISPLGLG
ncbi:unnamed protein product, partial [marine sediment metagenome]